MAKINPDDERELQVGDILECEMNLTGRLPRWDFSDDCGYSGRYQLVEVISITDEYFQVAYKNPNGQDRDWLFPLPAHSSYAPNRPGWPRFPEKSATLPVVEKYVWEEQIASEPTDIHTIPKRIFDEAIDRGERGVRRTLQSWPPMAVLKHKLDNPTKPQKVLWYWDNA